MHGSRDVTDLLAGALLLVIGLCTAVYTLMHYDVGTLDEMGPGMFPATIGWLLAGIGVLVALPAWFRRGVAPQPEWRPFTAIVGGVLLFAVTVERFGMVPALLALTLVSTLAGSKLRWRGALALGVSLCVLAALIFRVALEVPLPLLRWSP